MKKSIIVSLLLSALCTASAFAADIYMPGQKTNKNFKDFAQPFLKKHCLSCHDNDTMKGKLSLEDLGPVDETNAALWKSIWAQVSIKEMPPKDKKQPEIINRLLFTDWIVEELTETMKDKGGFTAHLDPKKGNYVDHDLLFGTLPANIKLSPPASPARIWRLNREEHMTRLNDLINKEPAYDPAKPGLRTHGDAVPINASGQLRVYFGFDRINVPDAGGGRIADVLKQAIGILSSEREHGLKNYPHLYSVNSAESLQILKQAQDFIRYMAYGAESIIFDPKQISDKVPGRSKGSIRPDQIIFTSKIMRPLTPVYDLMKKSDAKDDDIRAAVDSLFEMLTFRPPTKNESDKHLDIVNQAVLKLGKEEGIVMGLSAVFLNRDALFRTELAVNGKPDSFGRAMLQDWELGLAVNHALCYIKPNEELKNAIVSGKMKTKADVKREVERILNDDSIRKPRIIRFFQDYFDYELAGNICKDTEALAKTGVIKARFEDGHYRAMHDSVINTNRLIQLILQEDKNVLKELLTTDRVIVSKKKDNGGNVNKSMNYSKYFFDDAESLEVKGSKNKREVLQAKDIEYKFDDSKPIYGAIQRTLKAYKQGMEEKRYLTTAPKGQRMGILTHPVWLVSHSDAMDNHAIHRGIWIRERLLGNGIPDVPITVDAQLPYEPESTLRHRMRVTQEKYCWSCHEKFDPLGLTFEMYNHVGLFRKTEQGKPVVASGEIIDSGDPKLDGKVKDGFELIQKLANSERVEQVFIRHAFRFWMGRNETLNDRPVLIAAHKAYKESGGSMKALLLSLLTSDAFLYRKVE